MSSLDFFVPKESCMGRCENGFDSGKKCQCDTMCKYYKSCCIDFEAICGMTGMNPPRLCEQSQNFTSFKKNKSMLLLSLLSARGDTFELAEDDEDDLESTTLLPIADFAHKPQQRPEVTLVMNKPLPGPPTTTVPPSFNRPSSTEIMNAAAQTSAPPTTPAMTPGTTVAPDRDAEKCSGRPFDAFMQLKNGSIFAFRGESHLNINSPLTLLSGYRETSLCGCMVTIASCLSRHCS